MTKLRHLDWLKAHVAYDDDACLIWPFGRVNDGYGQVSIGNRVIRKAHRVMCELVKGPPPSDRHQAAHSCGNGHLACVHPKHLSWKTPIGNREDAKRHGTDYGRRGKAELRPAEVRAIRKSKKTHVELATIYGVSRRTIDRIITRELWPDTSRKWKNHGRYAKYERPTARH